MLTYIQRLINERDSLTATATNLADTAAREERDLTDTEQGSIATMQTRCAEIDSQIETYNAQAASTRAYAQLRSAVIAADAGDGTAGDPAGTGAPSGQGGGGTPARTGEAHVEVHEWSEAFTREAIGDYTGHGRSATVYLPSVMEGVGENRAVIMTTDPGMEHVMPTQRWEGNTTPTWRPSLLNLVNNVPVTVNNVDWIWIGPNPPSEAGEVAEGDLKPEAELTIDQRDASLKTYAHWKAITRQALEDWPRIRSEIENRLRLGVQRKIQSGVADALVNDPDIPVIPVGSGNFALLGGIRAAMADFENEDEGYGAVGVALNPLDWADIDMELLAGTLGGPVSNRGAWGLRFASSNKIPQGTAFVGDFPAALTLFTRTRTAVFMTDSHADFFLRNQLVIMAEARAFPAMTEPLALRKVGGAATPPASPPAAP